MNVPTKISTAFAFLLLLAPAAQSSWSVAGNIEPSSSYDTASWMWQGPPEAATNRVYFNVFTHSAPLGFFGASPNVAALGTQIETPTNEYHIGWFGVWVDCNGDGYVGMAEQGLREYTNKLLLDDSICPAVTGAANAWTPGAHNYNNWVSEFVPITRVLAGDTRVYADAAAGVWGDYGRPDQAAFFRSCALAPQPRGTYQSTGGALNYAECRTQQNGLDTYNNFNSAMDAVGDPAGLRGDDNPDGESFDWRTTGLQSQTAGSEDTQYSPATVWDCSREEVNETNTGTVVWGVNPQLGNTQNPTVPALVNHTVEGTDNLRGGTNSNCNTSDDRGGDTYSNWAAFYVGEADFNGVSPKNKKEADWNFNQVTAARGAAPMGPVAGALGIGSGGSSGTPSADAGIGFRSTSLLATSTMWTSPSVYASKLGMRTLKLDLANGNVGVSDPWWLSFYARVGPATTDRGFAFPSVGGVYGASQCGDNTSGIHNGWNCDVNAWYKNPDGSSITEPFRFARPGDAYIVRDIDCYDGRIGDSGIGIQPAFFGANPC